MAVDVCKKSRDIEVFADIALKFGHLHAVCGKSAKGLIERGRNVAYFKRKTGYIAGC